MSFIIQHMRWTVLAIVFMCSVPSACFHKTTLLMDVDTRSQEPDLYVRVLLDDHNVSDMPTWHLASPSGFIVQDGDVPHRQQRIHAHYVRITYYNNAFLLNNKRVSAKRLCIYTPDDQPVTYDGTQYAGYFTFAVSHKYVYVINTVDIEEYVFSVLRWEGWPGWPDEVNKAFAIMCRTYVIDKIWSQRNTRTHNLYDIKNTNIHQTYRGLHDFTRLRDAIDATRGIILTYQGKPIVAMYDACCGGVIPSYVSGFDFRKAPYLARSYPCTYCQSSTLYTWKRQYSTLVFHEMLKPHYRISRVDDIHVTRRDSAGVVKEVCIHTPNGNVYVPAKKLYTVFQGLRSLCFSVSQKEGSITFTGYGLGHHLGLCQWGAREMVRLGWDYASILHFYYPSVSFKRLRVTYKGK